jgi:branched-chain amino acid transport system substrate-binding protein
MKSLMISAAVLALLAGAAEAQVSDDAVKIAVLDDMSSVYADLTGPGGVAAVRMAVEDFGGKVLGKPVEVVFADHQNKADIAAATDGTGTTWTRWT